MKYFFIHGNNPTLSAAELASLISNELEIANNSFVIETNEILPVDKLIKRMGGVIKIGQITTEIDNFQNENILASIESIIQPEKIEKKFKFGISFYGSKKINVKILGMEFKKFLGDKMINSRWVTSRQDNLSSVVVEQNKLVPQNYKEDICGAEFVLIQSGNKLLIGKTLAVQRFKELSFRDYGRPARDDRSGMLPPKLAQIMINLAGVDTKSIILDPFCGSGTILSEAILMGYSNLIGSDISDKAIKDSEKNIKWITEKFNRKNIKLRLFQANAKTLGQKIKANLVDAIITEPYLGPQRGNVDQKKIKAELEKLYSEAIQQFKKVLKRNGVLTMVWPVFKNKQKDLLITPNIDGFKIISPMTSQIKKQLAITNRDTIIYGRENQKVWREIVILKKL